MAYEAKARENLEAAETLLPDEDGKSCLNASASRAYYAAYLAVVERLLSLGVPYTASNYFKHDELPEDGARRGVLDGEDSIDLRLLYDRRVKADYYEDNIELGEAAESFELAKRLLAKLLDGTDQR